LTSDIYRAGDRVSHSIEDWHDDFRSSRPEGGQITRIGGDVTELSWQGCAAGSALMHYRIAGGGHTWPGALAASGPGPVSHTVSATVVMWAFFQAHPLSRA